MGFNISKFNKILVVFLLVFSITFFNFSVAFAAPIFEAIVIIAVVISPASFIDFITCTIGDDVLGINTCGGGGGGGGGTPAGGGAGADANTAPTAINLSATQPNYCVTGPAATFNWNFSDPDAGDTQGAYQIQVFTNSSFSGASVIDSGKVSSASNSYASGSGKLVYNTTYYWRVMVWDNHNLASGQASGSSFSTPKHVYPTVNFRSSSQSPSVNEVVQFTDLTASAAALISWVWDIPDAVYQDGTTANSQNPSVKFTSTGTKNITLTAKDADNFQCSNTDTASSQQAIRILLPLPGWKEVSP